MIVAASGAVGGGQVQARDSTARGTYVRKAAASDLFEIRSSQLALTRSQNLAVRDFAGRMLQFHRKTQSELDAAAALVGIRSLRPALTATQRAMLNRLAAAQGADFDREYLLQQLRAHRLALVLHQDQARIGDTPALRRLAASAAPIVEQHFNQISALAAGL